MYAGFEDFLHAARILMLRGMDFTKALQCLNEFYPYESYKHICDVGYLNKKLII